MEISKTKLGDLGTMSGISPQSSPAAEVPTGKVIADRFEIVRVIGQGGMGVVYEVMDQIRQEPMALKFLRPELVSSDTAKQRFLNEARIAIALSHEHIVSVFDVARHEDSYFLSMELLRGQSLRQLMQELAAAGQKMPVAQALGIARDVAQALAYAHRTTIHRDIKPENIWILPDGKAKLMDFGIARLQSQTQGLTKTATALGTAYYMAPEQLVGSGQIDHRADQYSLGVVLYEMLTGSLPIGRGGAASSKRQGLGKKIDAVIEKMMAGSVSERFADDETVLAALQRASAPARTFSSTKVVVFSLTFILVCASGYGVFVFLDQRERAVAGQAAQTERDKENAAKQELLKQQAQREADEKLKEVAAEDARKALVAEAERKTREADMQKKAEKPRALQVDSASCAIVPAERPDLRPIYRVKASGKATMAPEKFIQAEVRGDVQVLGDTISRSTLKCKDWSVGPELGGPACVRRSSEPATSAWEASFEFQPKVAEHKIAVYVYRRSPEAPRLPLASAQVDDWAFRNLNCR